MAYSLMVIPDIHAPILIGSVAYAGVLANSSVQVLDPGAGKPRQAETSKEAMRKP